MKSAKIQELAPYTANLPGMNPTVDQRPSTTPGVTLAQLAQVAHARLLAGSAATRVHGVVQSAQSALPGDVFVALAGKKTHGARYIGEARARGAVAVITDEEGAVMHPHDSSLALLVCADPRASLGSLSALIYGDPSTKMAVIGVTGTAGKTTTTYLLESLYQAAGHRTGVIGTVETRIGDTRLASMFTTPEAPGLQALLAKMLELGVEVVLMEVSSHALDYGRVAGTRFAAAGFTNLSQDHLDYHGDMESYFEAKALLFDRHSPYAAQSAVICVDDVWGERMSQRTTSSLSVTTGNVAADWTLLDRHESASGRQQIRVRDPRGVERAFSLGLLGRHNAANALVALALAEVAGVKTTPEILQVWADIAVPGRLERVEAGQKFLAVVDYAHKPEALVKVLSALREHTEGKIAVVVGAGGDRDQGKRGLMGQACAQAAQLVIVTDDNPRSEDPAVIRAHVLEGALGYAGVDVEEIGNRAEAIARAVQWAQTGDTVLVAGKGHETYQEVNGVKRPFDDRVELAKAIDALTKK